MKRLLKQIFIYLSFLVFFNGCLSNQDTPSNSLDRLSLFETLQGKGSKKLTIKVDLSALLFREKSKEKYNAAVLIADKKGKKRTWKAELTPRGNMRERHCIMPPLKLDVAKADLEAASIDPIFDDLKLVLPCKSKENYYEAVHKEYLAYKLYNELTDLSFRVQLLDLTLEDSKESLASIHCKAFAIEKDDEIAERLAGSVLKPENASRNTLDKEAFDRACLFQFMIGNTDWYVSNLHNIKLFKIEAQSPPVPIPYDFDYAGFVNADYAGTDKRLNIDHVKQRFYLGACRDKAALAPTVQLFLDKETKLLNIVTDFDYLDATAKSALQIYLKDFFDILKDDARFEQMVLNHCDKHIKMKVGSGT